MFEWITKLFRRKKPSSTASRTSSSKGTSRAASAPSSLDEDKLVAMIVQVNSEFTQKYIAEHGLDNAMSVIGTPEFERASNEYQLPRWLAICGGDVELMKRIAAKAFQQVSGRPFNGF